jgi:hypothetical protein
MARLEGRPRKGLLIRILYFGARRTVGKILRRRRAPVTEPVQIMAHNPWVLIGSGAMEMALQRGSSVSFRLRELARLKAGTVAGCFW